MPKKRRISFKQFLRGIPKLSIRYMMDLHSERSIDECTEIKIDYKALNRAREKYFNRYPFYTWLAKLLRKI